MPEENDTPSGFKVVDRRSFSVDGTRRERPLEEVENPKNPPRTSPARSVPSEPEPEPYDEEGPVSFDTLVQSLATTAMFQLGLMVDPRGKPIPADLPNARRTIDLLEVLQQKTLGNLTPSEARLLEDVLYDLRLSFVEVNKRPAPKPK